jgi:micrococcal nuclease
MVILAAGAILSPAIAASRERTPSVDDALYQDAQPWELADNVETMVVHRVVDGDTLQLTYPNADWYYPTRIIGIQAPEMDGPYTEEGCYGQEAKEYLATLIPVGTEVYVQKDRTDTDRNDRRLRHIFLVDSETGGAYLVSEILVLGGYADARSYPPNDLYDDVLQEAEELAREEREGLWRACATSSGFGSG